MDLSLDIIYTSRNKNIFICFFIFILVTFTLLLSDSYISEYITFILLSIIAIITVNIKNLTLFFNFFFISIIISKLIALQYYSLNNSYFSSGGDEQIFNDLAINFSKTPITLNNPEFLVPAYKLYIIILSTWVRLLNFLYPQNIDYHFSLLMINSFFGAGSILYIKKLLIYFEKYKKLNSIKKIIILYNPFIIYYSSILLREIILLFFILLFFFYLFNKYCPFRKFFVFISIISVFLIRPSVTLLILFILFLYLLFQLKSIKLIITYLLLFSIPFIIFLIPIVELISNRSLDNFTVDRIEFITSQNSNNSIGLMLIQSNSLIIKLLLPIYILLSPLPPPILLFNFTLTSLLISFGSLINFISVIFLFQKVTYLFTKYPSFNINSYFQKKEFILLLIFIFSNLLMVTFSSADYRHNLIIYPFLFLLSIPDGRFNKSNKNLYTIILLICSIAIFSYIIYKNLF